MRRRRKEQVPAASAGATRHSTAEEASSASGSSRTGIPRWMATTTKRREEEKTVVHLVKAMEAHGLRGAPPKMYDRERRQRRRACQAVTCQPGRGGASPKCPRVLQPSAWSRGSCPSALRRHVGFMVSFARLLDQGTGRRAGELKCLVGLHRNASSTNEQLQVPLPYRFPYGLNQWRHLL